jgi:hypothetical protein
MVTIVRAWRLSGTIDPRRHYPRFEESGKALLLQSLVPKRIHVVSGTVAVCDADMRMAKHCTTVQAGAVTVPRLSAHRARRLALDAMDAALRERSIARVGLFLVAGPPSRDGTCVNYIYAARDRRAGGDVTVACAEVDLRTGSVAARLVDEA